MSRTLVLLDLDNVHELLAAMPARADQDGGDEAIVVVAMNTTTVRRVCPRWEDVSGMVARLLGAVAEGWAIGLRLHVIELAVVPTMPQTADHALGRLRAEAPDASTAGPFDQVVVATRDHGLRRALAPRQMVRPHPAGGPRAPWIDVWHGAAHVRAAPPPPTSFAPTNARPHGPHVSLAELGSGVAESVRADVPVEWVVHLPLVGLAAAIERAPSFLSQVGLTGQSVGGVWAMSPRLVDLDSDGPPRLAVLRSLGAEDGVEVSGDGSLPRLDGEAEASTIGIGAVRFPRIGLTASTSLPWGAWRGARGVWLGAAWQLDDAALLAKNPGATLPAVDARIQAWKHKQKLSSQARERGERPRDVPVVRGEVRVGPFRQPEAWWVGPLRSGGATFARSVWDVEGDWIVPVRVDVRAVPTVVHAATGAQIDLRPRDVDQPTLLSLRAAAGCRSIVETRDRRGGTHALLLGEGDPDRVEVLALPLWRVAPDHPLARLPLWVEVDEHGVSASASLDVPPSQSEP